MSWQELKSQGNDQFGKKQFEEATGHARCCCSALMCVFVQFVPTSDQCLSGDWREEDLVHLVQQSRDVADLERSLQGGAR